MLRRQNLQSRGYPKGSDESQKAFRGLVSCSKTSMNVVRPKIAPDVYGTMAIAKRQKINGLRRTGCSAVYTFAGNAGISSNMTDIHRQQCLDKQCTLQALEPRCSNPDNKSVMAAHVALEAV